MLPRIAITATVALVLTTAAIAQPQNWALDYAERSTNMFMWDSKTKPLIKSNVNNALAPQLIETLFGPPDMIQVENGRYLLASACRPHDCGTKGFLWIDTKIGTVVGAVLDSYSGTLRLGLPANANDLPATARSALVKWLTRENVTVRMVEAMNKKGQHISVAGIVHE
jgi:hypothetical protein